MNEDSNVEFSWNINRNVNVPIAFGMIGFVYSVLLLYSSCNHKAVIPYHETFIQNKKEILTKILYDRIKSLNDTVQRLQAFSRKPFSVVKDVEKDSLAKYDSYNRAKVALYNSQVELKQTKNGSADTSLKYFSSFVLINRDSLRIGFNRMDSLPYTTVKRDTIPIKDSLRIITRTTIYYTLIPIPITTKDTCSVLSSLSIYKDATLFLGTKSQPHLTNFFDDNSAFGFWFFFSVAQMTMWFLLVILLIGAVKQTDDVVVDEDVIGEDSLDTPPLANQYMLPFTLKTAAISSILPFVCTIVFVLLTYFYLINKNVIGNFVFLDNFNIRIKLYSFPGYGLAILCFTSYLFLSNKLELLDSSSKLETERKKDYERITKVFDFSFLCSAIVLSAFIFWVGILFNAINNTEAMRLYDIQYGRPFLSSDFVYLLGLMHTLLLFIFYIPTRIRFNSLNITQQKQEEFANQSTVSTKFWKGLFDILSTVLLTASPLITSFLQKILEEFFS